MPQLGQFWTAEWAIVDKGCSALLSMIPFAGAVPGVPRIGKRIWAIRPSNANSASIGILPAASTAYRFDQPHHCFLPHLDRPHQLELGPAAVEVVFRAMDFEVGVAG